jgi:hypothetical protein
MYCGIYNSYPSKFFLSHKFTKTEVYFLGVYILKSVLSHYVIGFQLYLYVWLMFVLKEKLWLLIGNYAHFLFKTVMN